MNETEEDATENVDQAKEEESCKEAVNEVICKEDLTSLFEQSDHNVNKVYFSAVSEKLTFEKVILFVCNSAKVR